MTSSYFKELLIEYESDSPDVTRQFFELDPFVSVDTEASTADASKPIKRQEYDITASNHQITDIQVIDFSKQNRAPREIGIQKVGNIATTGFSFQKSGDGCLFVQKDDGYRIISEENEKFHQPLFRKNIRLGLAISQEILSNTGLMILENRGLDKGAQSEMSMPKGSYMMNIVGRAENGKDDYMRSDDIPMEKAEASDFISSQIVNWYRYPGVMQVSVEEVKQ